MKKFLCITSFSFLFLFSFLFSQSPKYEVRAVWISVASGDWPKSTDATEQKRSLVEMFDLLQENNFNTIFFQVRPRGDVLYQSDIEPWANQLTGVLGKDPDWDPLEFAIEEAHKRGMELHAWFNVAKVWGLGDLPVNAQHVTRKHRNWVQQVEGEWWIDMGIPEARDYTQHVAMEIVQKHDVDGIQFDFVRYPNESFNDWKTFLQYSDGMPKDEWRRNNITSFVKNCYEQIQKEKPWMKVGSAPIGIYQSIDGAESSFAGYSGVFQDSRRWLKEGIHDYLAPQIYWSIGEQKNPNDPDFETLCRDWVSENYGRHIYAGIGIYRDNVRTEMREQVEVSRSARTQGEAFFRYENLRGILYQLGTVYRSKSLFPPMMWKDSLPPLPPHNISYEEKKTSTIIHWEIPKPADDGGLPFWYVVYRSLENPVDTRRAENIAAVVPSYQTSFWDEEKENGKKYFYTVTSLDRCGNESALNTEHQNEAQSLVPLLSQNFPNPFVSATYFSIELPYRSFVSIIAKHTVTQQETLLVNGMMNPGIHIISFTDKNFPAGSIEYRMSAGKFFIEKIMEKK